MAEVPMTWRDVFSKSLEINGNSPDFPINGIQEIFHEIKGNCVKIN
jgi:hypothetical protein